MWPCSQGVQRLRGKEEQLRTISKAGIIPEVWAEYKGRSILFGGSIVWKGIIGQVTLELNLETWKGIFTIEREEGNGGHMYEFGQRCLVKMGLLCVYCLSLRFWMVGII